MIYITFFTLHAFIIMRIIKTQPMESMSNQAILSFWRHILIDCLQLEESQDNTLWNYETTTTRQVTVKPLFHTRYFVSMSLAQFEPVWQRYVASREANHFTD